MDNLEYIEAFFNEGLSAERKKEFEQRIAADRAFAEEVAFYLSMKQVAYDEKTEERAKFKHLYTHGQPGDHVVKHEPTLVRRLWPWAAAAAVMVGLILGGYLFLSDSSSPRQLADAYFKKQFQNLSVKMSGTEDSLQKAKRLYNEGKFTEALQHFEKIIASDTASFSAIKFAGITCLRLRQYDTAMNYFRQLETYSLYSNPALFYQALTLLKRDQQDDEQRAKRLLEHIVDHDLEGKKEAEEWLKKWKD